MFGKKIYDTAWMLGRVFIMIEPKRIWDDNQFFGFTGSPEHGFYIRQIADFIFFSLNIHHRDRADSGDIPGGVRLIKLMQGGNQYTATVINASEDGVTVIIREVYQDPSQAGRLSFPPRGAEPTRSYISDRIIRRELEYEESLSGEPTYTIVGNIPIVLRESLLTEVLTMGDNVMKISSEIAPPGIIGPFCLETIITDKPEIFTFEISARIVAGSNVGIGTSPYAYLKYGEKMYMGRRIAREIKKGIQKKQLCKIVY